MSCWHCQRSGRCVCVGCDGKCISCLNRDRVADELRLADKFGIDVRNPRSYTIVRTLQGFHRILKPPPGVAA